MKQVQWTKVILETFLEESGINDRIKMEDDKARVLESIMRTRFAGWTISKQEVELGIPKDTINKYIRELKDLYDATQKNSMILPVRVNKSKWEADNLDK